MTTVAEVFGNPLHWPGLSTTDRFFAGVECEIEALNGPVNVDGFQCIPDHSLRNGGVEYVSIPLTRDDLLLKFEQLHATLKLKPENDPFSHRTSTHVHVNCLSMPVADVRTMVLLYALFEECFFLQVKPIRRENIHCVPLTETPLPAIYKKDIMGMWKMWSKYTALNLKRLSDLGTVEFRHMHGTGDKEEMAVWLQLLENLWTLAHTTSVNATTLNKETVLKWFDTIFAPSPRIMAYRNSLFEIIRNSYLDVKFSV